MSEKICNACKITKTLDNFTNNLKYKFGKENKCKECVKEKNKTKIEKLRESQRKWREKNPDYMKEYGKKPEIIAYQKEYYKDHKEECLNYTKEWRKNNPEKYKITRKNYEENNKDKMNEYHRNWKQNKRENDINYKIKENTSRRIRYELNAFLKTNKTKRTTEYIGCSIEELKLHIESKFKDSMNWDNYGSYWHIDHIIPCAAWDLTKEEDNMYCWNFRNLQPLIASENQSKKDKYDIKDKEKYIETMKGVLGRVVSEVAEV
jgi:hypothetical protein